MFCTTLRRRKSFAAILKSTDLTSSLELKGTSKATEQLSKLLITLTPENDLKTHDIALPLASPTNGTSHNSRQLRLLLLSPSRVSSSNLTSTIKRIEHFASLTGGQDLAIVFLLYPGDVTSEEVAAAGMLAYSKLQAELMDLDMPSIPILPLPKLDGLAALLKNHQTALATPRLSKHQTGDETPFHLLRKCSVNAPLSRDAAFRLTDLFVNLQELAEACACETLSMPSSSSESGRYKDTQEMENGSGHGKLNSFRHMQGDAEYKNLVDFWKVEFAV